MNVDHGQLFIDNEDVSVTPARHRGIAMVFQSYALFPNMNVWDNIAFGLKMQKMSSDKIKKRATK